MSFCFSTSSAWAGDLAVGTGHQVWREFAPRNQVTGDSSSAVLTHLLPLSTKRVSSATSSLALARPRPLALPTTVSQRLVEGPRRGRCDLFPRTPLSSRREGKADTEALPKTPKPNDDRNRTPQTHDTPSVRISNGRMMVS